MTFEKKGIARVLSAKRVFCTATFNKERQNNLLSGVTKVEAMPNGAKIVIAISA